MLLAVLLSVSPLGCRCAPQGGAAQKEIEAIGHYAAMSEIHAALVAGDLAAVKDLSRQLEGGEAAEAAASDPALAAHLDRLHGAVGFAVAATDLEDAATAVAVMGRACGGCHAAAGSPLVVPAAPPATGTRADHAAGAQAAWLGYLAGDAGILRAGLALYAGAAEAPGDAVAAGLTSDPAERASAVATWLAGCAACH